MARRTDQENGVERWGPLAVILLLALGLRLVAAVVVTSYVERKGTLCVFPDTAAYWELGRTIVDGDPYLIRQAGGPHYALRTPGYPLFLAGCRWAFGPSLLAVRVVQAVLGTLAVALVAGLTRETVGEGKNPGYWSRPLMAATLAAIEPYTVGTTALVLSEALFVPMMLAGLWGLARLWRGGGRPVVVALVTGLAMGAAVLVRPSWALFVPGAIGFWVAVAGRTDRGRAIRSAVLVAFGTALIMMPWWIRNERVLGRFVPTALWVGASLYDGISPTADGSSAMEFLDAPDVAPLGEVEQDADLRKRSIAFARANPGRVLELAFVKLGRFWSPWPNADTLQAPGVTAGSAVVTLPVFALLAVGLWDQRRDPRSLLVLAGPLAYFCVLHLVFVSSIRYRIPGEVPAMGLAAVGWDRIRSGWFESRKRIENSDKTQM
jgi:4-amino-4-deoxy-L-arabinose transferase-like glycosyltransferase